MKTSDIEDILNYCDYCGCEIAVPMDVTLYICPDCAYPNANKIDNNPEDDYDQGFQNGIIPLLYQPFQVQGCYHV